MLTSVSRFGSLLVLVVEKQEKEGEGRGGVYISKLTTLGLPLTISKVHTQHNVDISP